MPIVPLTPGSLRGTWKHNDTRFILLLAGLCGWTGRTEKGKGTVHLHAKDGTEMTVPDNTRLNANVFASWARRVWTHRSADAKPRIIWASMEDCKLDASHRRAVWEGLDMKPYTPPETPVPEITEHYEAVLAEPEKATDDPDDDPYRIMNRGRTILTADTVDGAIEVATSMLTSDSGQWTVVEIATGKTMATLNWAGDEGVYKIMPYVDKMGRSSGLVMERTWVDGHLDYQCVDCDFTGPSPNTVGSHRRKHGKFTKPQGHHSNKSVREQQQEQIMTTGVEMSTGAAATTGVVPPSDFNPMAVHTGLRTPGLGHHDHLKERPPVEPIPVQAMENAIAETKLRRILGIVAPELLRENERLTAELVMMQERAEAAEAKLAQLRGLL